MRYLAKIKLLGELYLTQRFFGLFAVAIVLFILSFGMPLLFPLAQLALIMVLFTLLLDIALLFRLRAISAERTTPKLLSLGDNNTITLTVTNSSGMELKLDIIDEVPVQLQIRDLLISRTIGAQQTTQINYELRPVSRGVYKFRAIRLFASTKIGLAQRRYTEHADQEVPVYPSVIMMKQFELMAFAKISNHEGIKHTRKLGHSYEFEQIKNYVQGDDYRSINWKATGRRGDLMINQYEDERSQQIYCIIDKSRSMHMPFNGLSLLDYAINTSLVISNIALIKHDRTGLLTFSDKLGNFVKADRRRSQLRNLLNILYKQQSRDLEANYELLYMATRNMIKSRSLLFLFTNFESRYALERVLPILRRLNKGHLLVVIMFQNTEIANSLNEGAQNVEEIYANTIAEGIMNEKQQMVNELARFGIQCIYTRPEDLSMNTVNKYLELKSRGLI